MGQGKVGLFRFVFELIVTLLFQFEELRKKHDAYKTKKEAEMAQVVQAVCHFLVFIISMVEFLNLVSQRIS